MRNDEQTKRMADLLKSGATMLFEHCPECNSPLFKIKNDVWCPSCNKRVIIVKEGEESKVTSLLLLEETEKTIMTKLQEINQWIKHEDDPSKLLEMGVLLSKWLEIVGRIRDIQKNATKNN
jgi:UPF0148 protein